MPDTVDRRIVEMRFDNKDFEKNIGDTLISLETLKRALEMNDSSRGLEEVAKAADKVDLTGIQNGVEEASRQFSAMEVVAITALANITNSAVNAGKRLVSSFVSPLISGGKQRAMNMAQAKFMFKGLGYAEKEIGTASDPNTIMGRIYKGVEGTFYSLDRAALVASQLMASGMKGTSEEMTKTLKAVAGVSSMFGADYDRVGQIFAKIKATDKAMGGDLSDLSMYGVPAAQKIADYLNEVNNTSKYTQESVQEMARKGQIDFKTFAGAFESYGEQAAKSKQLFTGAFEDMLAAMGRVGEKGWTPLLNLARDFLNAIVPLIDNVSGLLGPAFESFGTIVDGVSNKITTFVDVLSAMVNYDDTIEALNALVKSEVIDKSRVETLKKLFETKPLVAYQKAIENVKKAYEGFDGEVNALAKLITFLTHFEVQLGTQGIGGNWAKAIRAVKYLLIDIAILFEYVKQVGSAILKAFSPLTSLIPGLIGVILDAIIEIETLFSRLMFAVDESGLFQGIIKIVSELTASFVDFAKNIPTTIGDFFSDFADGLATIGSIKDSVISGITSAISRLFQVIHDYGGPVGKIISGFKDAIISIKDLLKGGSLLDVLGLVGKGAIGYGIWNVIQGLLRPINNLRKGLEAFRRGGSIGAFFGSLGNLVVGEGFDQIRLDLINLEYTLQNFMKVIKAGVLLILASAIMELAIALKLLASVDSARLRTATTALGALMAELTIVSSRMQAMSTKGIIALAIGIRILAGAVKKLADIDPEGLARGIVGVLSLIAMLVLASERLAEINGSMAKVGSKNIMPMVGAMIGMAIAVKLLVRPVKQLAQLSVNELAKGLISVGIILGLLAGVMILFSRYMNMAPDTKGLNAWMGKRGQLYSLVFTVLMLAAGVNLMVRAVKELGSMEVEELEKGLSSLAIIFAILIAFVGIFEAIGSIGGVDVKGGPLLALGASMVLLALAMNMLMGPIKEMGSMDLTALQQGVNAMAVILLAVAGFLTILQMVGMTGGNILAASAALVIMAVGLNIMAAALANIASIENVFVAILNMAAALGVLALAMYFMQEAIIGAAAMIIVAAAIAILAPALALLSALKLGKVAGGLLVLGLALVAFGALSVILLAAVVPMIALAGAVALLGLGVAALAVGMGLLAAAFSAGMDPILEGLVRLSEIIPTIATNLARGFGAFLDEMANLGDSFLNLVLTIGNVIIQSLNELGPGFTEAGVNLLINLLTAINSRMEEITILGVEIVINFLEGIASKMGDIAMAGYDLFIGFFNGVADAITTKGPELRRSLENILLAVIQEVVAWIPVIGEKGAAAIQEYRDGLMSEDVPADAKNIAEETSENLEVPSQVNNGENTITGLITGIDNKLPALRSKATEAGNIVDEIIRKQNLIKSPSRRLAETGRYLMLGLISGVDSLTGKYQNRANNIATMMIDSANSSIDSITAAMNRTISPAFNMGGASAMLADGIRVKASGTVEMERQESLISQLNAMVSDLGQIIQEQETDHTYNFNIPFDINGRELARAQATYTQEELDRMQMRENRKLGIL